jgi:NAD(P)-dependent dehydrogenase (short-subunit alcohol dehydrogenase family)
VINIIGAERNDPKFIASATGGAALTAFTRALGKAASDDGMRVVAISPGQVATERGEVFMRKLAKTELGDENRWSEYYRKLPFGRPASVEEIASAVAFLASPRSGYTNGTVLTIDGAPRLVP